MGLKESSGQRKDRLAKSKVRRNENRRAKNKARIKKAGRKARKGVFGI